MRTTIIQQPPKFKPIDLIIVIESQEELYALQELMRMSVTIPNEVYGYGQAVSQQRMVLDNVMQDIHNTLSKY